MYSSLYDSASYLTMMLLRRKDGTIIGNHDTSKLLQRMLTTPEWQRYFHIIKQPHFNALSTLPFNKVGQWYYNTTTIQWHDNATLQAMRAIILDTTRRRLYYATILTQREINTMRVWWYNSTTVPRQDATTLRHYFSTSLHHYDASRS